MKNLKEMYEELSGALYNQTNIEDLLDEFIKEGGNINQKNSEGRTLLIEAIALANLENVTTLIKKGASLTIMNPKGGDVLEYISKTSNFDIFKTIVRDKKFNVNKPMKNGDSLLITLIKNHIKRPIKEYIEELLNVDKININSQGMDGYTALHHAIFDHSILELLLKHGAKCDIPNTSNMYTPVMYAIEKCKIESLKLLTNFKNINLDLKDRNGNTALHIAIKNLSVERTKILLSAKADPNIYNDAQETPLSIIINDKYVINNRISTEQQKIKERNIIASLLDHGADTEIYDKNGNTLLHNAVLKNEEKIVELIAQKKHDINITNDENNTALHIATEKNSKNIVKTLLYYKANTNLYNSNYETPVHIAMKNGAIDIINMLIAADDTNLELPDVNQKTPINLMIDNNYEILKSLIEYENTLLFDIVFNNKNENTRKIIFDAILDIDKNGHSESLYYSSKFLDYSIKYHNKIIHKDNLGNFFNKYEETELIKLIKKHEFFCIDNAKKIHSIIEYLDGLDVSYERIKVIMNNVTNIYAFMDPLQNNLFNLLISRSIHHTHLFEHTGDLNMFFDNYDAYEISELLKKHKFFDLKLLSNEDVFDVIQHKLYKIINYFTQFNLPYNKIRDLIKNIADEALYNHIEYSIIDYTIHNNDELLLATVLRTYEIHNNTEELVILQKCDEQKIIKLIDIFRINQNKYDINLYDLSNIKDIESIKQLIETLKPIFSFDSTFKIIDALSIIPSEEDNHYNNKYLAIYNILNEYFNSYDINEKLYNYLLEQDDSYIIFNDNSKDRYIKCFNEEDNIKAQILKALVQEGIDIFQIFKDIPLERLIDYNKENLLQQKIDSGFKFDESLLYYALNKNDNSSHNSIITMILGNLDSTQYTPEGIKNNIDILYDFWNKSNIRNKKIFFNSMLQTQDLLVAFGGSIKDIENKIEDLYLLELFSYDEDCKQTVVEVITKPEEFDKFKEENQVLSLANDCCNLINLKNDTKYKEEYNKIRSQLFDLRGREQKIFLEQTTISSYEEIISNTSLEDLSSSNILTLIGLDDPN